MRAYIETKKNGRPEQTIVHENVSSLVLGITVQNEGTREYCVDFRYVFGQLMVTIRDHKNDGFVEFYVPPTQEDLAELAAFISGGESK